jgi:3-phosphoshikimate 1-carboxyvinyltransferase
VWTPAAPGSKYYTLRYLLNALLADGESVVRRPALSEDTAVLVGAMQALGADTSWEHAVADGGTWQLRVRGVGGRPRAPAGGVLRVGNAGAVLRLLLGICALLPEVRFETDHPESLGKRPNGELLEALRAIGARIEAQGAHGGLPIALRGGDLEGGAVAISGSTSSQYLSALLYLAPLLPAGLSISVTGTVRSAPLIRTTLRALRRAGIDLRASDDLRHYVVPGGQRYHAATFEVPGDGPSAAALAAAAMVTGVPLRLNRLPTADEDVRALLEGLAALGASLDAGASADDLSCVTIAGRGRLRSATIDGDACIDSVPALVAAACFADGESRFENVATLRLKESDRISDLCDVLRRAGCDVEPQTEAIVARGQPHGIEGGTTVVGHDDHRVVQAAAIVALRSRRGMTITGADAVAKSYPGFFDELAGLGAQVRVPRP